MSSTTDNTAARAHKPATAARMYDYYLGGIHNFPADREAARRVLELFPFVPAAARANRAFLRRAVRELTSAGLRQFLDIGSGIPTEGNVHEIAQRSAPDSRVIYVDIDPVAVSESLDILNGNPLATAIQADLREPQSILDHPAVRRSLDLAQPVALLLVAVLHFVPDNTQAYEVVGHLVDKLPSGSHLAIAQIAAETFMRNDDEVTIGRDVYSSQTTTPITARTREEMKPFFDGLDLLEPGLVWAHSWRPDGSPDAGQDSDDEAMRSGEWVGVAVKP